MIAHWSAVSERMTNEVRPGPAPIRSRGSSYKLSVRITNEDGRCRCGRQLPVGAHCVEFDQVPDSLSGILEGEVFCSRPCVRAYLLETLAMLDVPSASTVIANVEEVCTSLRALFMTS